VGNKWKESFRKVVMESEMIQTETKDGEHIEAPKVTGEQNVVPPSEVEGLKSVTEESVLNKTEESTILEVRNVKKKILNVEPAENVPKDFAEYLNDSSNTTVEEKLKSAPTSVIVAPKPVDRPKENGESELNGKAELSDPLLETNIETVSSENIEDLKVDPKVESKVEEPTVTVADLVEEAEKKEEPEPPSDPPEEMEVDNVHTEAIPKSEETLKTVVKDTVTESEADIVRKAEEALAKSPVKRVEKVETALPKSPKKPIVEKKPIIESPIKAVKAAELVQEWDDDMEDEEIKKEEGKKGVDSADESLSSDDKAEIAPRKSSRAPKPSEKKLASKEQENFKPDDEESIDAIAKEMEKPDAEIKSGKKDLKSPRKGRKGTGEAKEDWVTLIFGENGEKVTEKGRKKGDDSKEEDDKDDVPEAEEFLMDQTPFQAEKAKRGGRPRKKDLDEKLDGVAKLGSNMYFYTGPGGSKGGRDSPTSMHSDEEDAGGKKSQSDSVRKSGRAGKGRNPRLDREDEFVEIPQNKAKEASLNPSWLKNHDGKTPTSTKKPQTIPITPVTSKSSEKTPVKKEKDPVMDAAAEEIALAMEKQRVAEEEKSYALKLAEMDKELPEFDPAKFEKGYTPKTVKKGEDEYVIVVHGVADTGLCGNYWGDLTSLPSRRRSKAPETLQLGAGEAVGDRRGSVGSSSSTDTPTSTKKTPQPKKAASTPSANVKRETTPKATLKRETTPKTAPKRETTPKAAPKRETTPKAAPKQSAKKQATRPERKVEKKPVLEAESSMDESEPETLPEPKAKSKKRKAEAEPEIKKEKKSKKEEVDSETDEQKGFSDYDSAGPEPSPLRGNKKSGSNSDTNGDNAASGDVLSAPVSSKQQTAVNAALAAGVPAGQQRSVSCVADTSTQREVVVECFAPYDDHRWVNIGKERDGMSPDAVQYARALRPPYHLLSFLRIKGHSTKGMSCTDKNTMVFVVLEGEITVILHTTQFNAKKGDSFYIPPKNYYNLINQKVREAELSLIQFQYDGPLPTVQPSQGNN